MRRTWVEETPQDNHQKNHPENHQNGASRTWPLTLCRWNFRDHKALQWQLLTLHAANTNIVFY